MRYEPDQYTRTTEGSSVLCHARVMKRPRLVRIGTDWRRPPEGCIVRQGTATIADGWAGDDKV